MSLNKVHELFFNGQAPIVPSCNPPKRVYSHHKRYCELLLNVKTKCLYKWGNCVVLTDIEFKILELLFDNPNKIFSREEIFKFAYVENARWVRDSHLICQSDIIAGSDSVKRMIDTHISHIRAKAKKTLHLNRFIDTLRNSKKSPVKGGYCLDVDTDHGII